MMLKCRDVGQLLYDYLEGALAPMESQALEAHLADCPGCLAFINTYRQTIHLSQALPRVEIPSELQQKLRSFVRSGKPTRSSSWWRRLWRDLTAR